MTVNPATSFYKVPSDGTSVLDIVQRGSEADLRNTSRRDGSRFLKSLNTFGGNININKNEQLKK